MKTLIAARSISAGSADTETGRQSDSMDSCKVQAGHSEPAMGDISLHPDWHRVRDAVDRFAELDGLVESDDTASKL